jgi:hypothetical protein
MTRMTEDAYSVWIDGTAIEYTSKAASQPCEFNEELTGCSISKQCKYVSNEKSPRYFCEDHFFEHIAPKTKMYIKVISADGVHYTPVTGIDEDHGRSVAGYL